MNDSEKRFGELLAKYRASRRMSLREFCRAVKVDSSNISKIERGKAAPPKNRKIIEKYAEVLGFKEDDAKWQEFYHSSCLENNIIPDDVDKKLIPAFFRTASSRKPTNEERDKIIELINKA